MNRFRIPEIFLGCFLTIAVFAAGMLFVRYEQAANPAQTLKGQEAAGQDHKSGNPDAELTGSTWLTKDAAGFFTFGLVLVGIGQAFLFFFQLRYMRTGMEDARSTAEAARVSAEAAKQQAELAKIGVIDLERAYLAVGPTEIETRFIHKPGATHYVPTDPKEVVVRLYVHNTGRTGAVLKKIYGEFSQTPPVGDVPVYEHGSATVTDISIAAGDKAVLSPFEFANSNPSDQFFWGYVEYVDIFRNMRTARFCSVIFPHEKRNSPQGETIYSKYQMAGSDGWRECD